MSLKRVLIVSAIACFATAAEAQISDGGDPEALAADLENLDVSPAAGSEVDPWEGFNRKMFAVHNVLDDNLLVPAAKVYRATTPKRGRKGLRNFLANARTPVILINDILQGEFGRASETAGRFVINSTIGLGGMADPAEHLGIAQHSEDFGQTLAVWGVASGPYMFIPLMGPSSIRDSFGSAIDTGLDPLIYIRTNPAQYARYSRAGATALSLREPLIEPLEGIEEKSLDYYASFRSFYLQVRKREIANGKANFEDLPDIGDFDDFEDFDEIE